MAKFIRTSKVERPPSKTKTIKSKPKSPSISPNPPSKSLRIRTPTTHTIVKSKSPQKQLAVPIKRKMFFNSQNSKKPLTLIDESEPPKKVIDLVQKQIKKPEINTRKTENSKIVEEQNPKNKTDTLIKRTGLVISNENEEMPEKKYNFKRLVPFTEKLISIEDNLKPKKEVYDVEEILDKKKFGRFFRYLIKWEGYNDEENSWEPKKNLPLNLVKEFEEKNQCLTKNYEKDVENLEEDLAKKTFVVTDDRLNFNLEEPMKKELYDIEKSCAKGDLNLDPSNSAKNHEEPKENDDDNKMNIEPPIKKIDKKNKKIGHFIKKPQRNPDVLEIEEEKTTNDTQKSSKKPQIEKETLLINSDYEGPGSNRATKYGDFRLGDRFDGIKKLRYNKKLGVVYGIVEWKPRDDGFVPLTSKINLEHLKANVPNETITFLVNTLISMQEKQRKPTIIEEMGTVSNGN